MMNGNKEAIMAETDNANMKYGKVSIEEVSDRHYKVCCLMLNTGDTPDDGGSHEVVAHHHVIVSKAESTITIYDADREGGEPAGAVMPLSSFRALQMFLAAIDEDPTPVMTDAEQAQYHADQLMARYAANTN